ncbi:MAG: endonuclease domain-containing protein [Bacteroidota bacterium]
MLRAGGVQGFTFRRQRPVLNYIVDFMCKELMLIIEAAGDPVDGSIHDLKEVIENDVRRQEHLEQAGFKVIRFTNEEVLHHINSVQQTIEDEVKAIMDQENIAAPHRGKYRRRKT